MRSIWLLVAAMLVFAGAIHAQVAAPLLNPVVSSTTNFRLPSGSTKPFNVAVLPWSGPSRVGIGVFTDTTFDRTKLNQPTEEVASGDGTLVQFRWVGEAFAFAAEFADHSLDLTGNFAPGSVDIESSLVGVAYQGGEVFSIGIGQQTRELFIDGEIEKETLPMIGATVRPGEVLYIGAAFGEATVEQVDPFSTPAVSGEVDRSVQRVGVGLFGRNDDFGWHVEVYKEEKDSAQDTVTGVQVDEEESTGCTVEVILFGGLLLGWEHFDTDLIGTNGVINREDEFDVLSVGWSGMEGLSLVVSLHESESTDVDPASADFGEVLEFTSTFVGAAWLF